MKALHESEKRAEIAEFQGFYGPFTVTEKLLQKIWLRGDFNGAAARTLDGVPVKIHFPGRWNRMEGPDFKGGRFAIDGREITGDVELHFHSADWEKHGHHRDPNYDHVVLHVLLFYPAANAPRVRTLSGREPAAIVLLDLLYHDLEEYAAEEAIEATLDRDHWQATEELASLPEDDRVRLLEKHARRRWEDKVRFARLRVEKLGWTAACHQTALEILGYRRNRGAMLTVATRYPLAAWIGGALSEETLLAAARWIVRGARPANHPRRRLRQYAAMVAACPDWPGRGAEFLKEFADSVNLADENASGWGTRRFRSGLRIRHLRETFGATITGDAIGGSRLDTLICDGLLPLNAARNADLAAVLFPVWFAWYAGDLPERVTGSLRTAGITGPGAARVICNGFCQGVLSLSLEKRSDPLVCFEE